MCFKKNRITIFLLVIGLVFNPVIPAGANNGSSITNQKQPQKLEVVIGAGPVFKPFHLGGYFSVQPGTPAYKPNYIHPEYGCSWQGVSGQVFSLDYKPMKKLVLVVTGVINGYSVEMVGLTGMPSAFGEGGYEITLGYQPSASYGYLYIQLFNLQGSVLSDMIPFNAYPDCSRNLAIINFQQIRR